MMRRLLLLACLMLIGTPSWAVISKVQDGATMVLGTSPSVVLGSNVTAGNMLAVCAHTGSTITAISDTQGNTWNAGTPASGMYIYWVKGAKAGATTVNLTCSSGAAFCGFTVAEFSGMGTAPTQDGSGVQSTYGTATTIQTNTLSTSGGNPELIFGCGFTDSVQTPSGLIDYGAGGGLRPHSPTKDRPPAAVVRPWRERFSRYRPPARSAFNGPLPRRGR